MLDRINNDKIYKIILSVMGGMVFFLLVSVIVLFVRLSIDEQLIKSMEISLANEALTLDGGSGVALSDTESFGSDVSLNESEADLIIDNNENISIMTTDGEVSDDKRYVYLTFDDGPSSNTESILKILNEYDVKATFFVNGKNNEDLRDLITKIHEEGHSVGMHSYSHRYADIYKSDESFLDDLDLIEHLIYAQTGEHPYLYRFPGGSSNSVSKTTIKNYISILKDRNIEYVDWNISSSDATGTTVTDPKVLTSNVLDAFKKCDYHTNVVLMHDTDLRDSTVEALPDIIKGLRNMGAVLKPVTKDTPAVHHVEK